MNSESDVPGSGVTLQGVLDRITYQNEENGFTVARLSPAGQGGEGVTVVGSLAGVPVGSTVSLEGCWVRDRQYGWQVRIRDYQIEKPNTLNGLERYLGSGLIKGIGPRFASRIVSHFGLNTLDILEQEPDRLAEVEGLGEKRLAKIKQAWQEQKSIQEIMLFLQGHGISAAFAVKIFRAYREDAVSVVRDNPYRLSEDIWGIGFRSADRIALALGIPIQDHRRARAGLLFALGEGADEGHCFLERRTLAARCRSLLDPGDECPDLAAMIVDVLPDLVNSEKIVIDHDNIYLAPFYYSEVGIAARVMDFLRAGAPYPVLQKETALAWAAEKMGVEFAPEQREALSLALTSSLAVITGGPGTGKSTILKGLILILQAKGVSIEVAAPTGRAAKRLSETCGLEARTIHRLLEYDLSIRGFKRDSQNPLKAELVIVDEASMLDVVLANALFRAVKPGGALLLVGDVDQLPSVGPGNVLRDLIDSGSIPVARLARIFRQDRGSLISFNAGRINQGSFPELMPDYKGPKDFYFMERDEAEDIEQEIISLCGGRLQRKFGFDPLRDIQVLTPMRKGVVGAENLNSRLQQTINPSVSEASGSGSRVIRTGDRVMQVRNNYDKEVFNGDLGFVIADNHEERSLLVDFEGRKVEYEAADLNELTLAYAVTVHKSQGSEFKCVIVPVHTSHYPMLQRNLIYTGVTRGKNLVIMIGSRKAIFIAIRNNKVVSRNSMLKERIMSW
ncbi:MAG: ATP-dependent RecD-like DNA helicase [Desulfurivibrionaceae bacterium]